MGAWTRPVPGVPYQADVRSLLASAVSSLGNESAPALQHVPEIGDLPWELREMIAWHSIDSPLWRMLSALFRFEKVKTLLQPGDKEIVYELSRIKEWQRESGGDISCGRAQDGNDSVIVYLDDYGMQRIEHFSSQLTSYTQARVHTASWYIVEPLTFVDGVKVKVKVSNTTVHHKNTTHSHVQRHRVTLPDYTKAAAARCKSGTRPIRRRRPSDGTTWRISRGASAAWTSRAPPAWPCTATTAGHSASSRTRGPVPSTTRPSSCCTRSRPRISCVCRCRCRTRATPSRFGCRTTGHGKMIAYWYVLHELPAIH